MNGFHRHLDDLQAQGMLRTLRTVEGPQGPQVEIGGRTVLLLCSNNYLGLANHPLLVEAACRATARYGTGSGGSRLISGTMTAHADLEACIAAFKGTPAALVFNSGVAANVGILQGLTGPDDVIFSDALNHASIIDGCRLSPAKTVVYPHGDTDALAALMAHEAPRRRGRWLIVTDGVFSMDGDLAPLPGLVALKDRYDALLMVDDAHGTGVLGETGRGTAEHLGCLRGVDLHMGTLGKALGGFGAFVAAEGAVIETLINRARSFIFSTSLPPGVLAAAQAAFELVASDEGRQRRDALWRNRRLFAAALQQGGLDLLGSQSQILPIHTVLPEPTMRASAALLQQGVFVQGIRPPTVASGQCRLRATLMADHDPDALLAAADKILQVLEATAP